jgi:RNA-directed DNA polymerase
MMNGYGKSNSPMVPEKSPNKACKQAAGVVEGRGPAKGNPHKRNAAPGIDGETWRQYEEQLEENLRRLSERLKRGAYRANLVHRVYIPKTDGRRRPIGILVLEDEIVQQAMAEVLSAVYESGFLGFSYGFRPRRNHHQASDALSVGILTKKVSWVLDAHICGFSTPSGTNGW